MPQVAQLGDLLTVSQAAKELNLTERAVRHRIKAETLVATKLGPGTAPYVIHRDEIARVNKKGGAAA